MRVGRMVRQVLGQCRQIHASRAAALVKVVDGIVQGGRLSPATIGRSLVGSARPKHGIKCVDRLVGNPHLATERWSLFRAMAHRLLAGCDRPVILIDWTQVMGTHQALVAAVPIGGRALPIYLEVHPQKKLSNAEVEGRFLRQLHGVLPPGCRPIIVTDAGFKGPLFQAILAMSWDFLGRIRGTSKAVTADGDTMSKEAFYAKASTTPRELGTFGLFVKQRISCRLVLVRKRRKPGPKLPPPKCKEERELRQAALDPWLIATSLSDGNAAYVVGIYAKRMQIEELFRDVKNHRFGWCLRDVRTASTARAAVLLLLASLALLVVTLIGLNAEKSGAQRHYQANTEKTRVLSLFVLGCAILSRHDDQYVSRAGFLAALSSIPALVRA